MRKRALRWVSVQDELPGFLDRVLVYNGVHLWLTAWKPGLMRGDVKYPVTHWARAVGLPYELRFAAVDADPECYGEARAIAAAERRVRRRAVA